MLVKSFVLLVAVAALGTWFAVSKTDAQRTGVEPDIGGTWERTPDDWFGKNPDNPVLPGGKAALRPPSPALRIRCDQATARSRGGRCARVSPA